MMEHKLYRYFEKLPFTFEQDKLEKALKQVLEIAPWPNSKDTKYHQICLTKRNGVQAPECFYEGNGGVYHLMIDGKEEVRQQHLDESEYSEFPWEFSHTYFKEIYDKINKYCKKEYNSTLGRFRLMLSKPRESLSWHRDPEPRLHVPIITNIGAKMVIEDEVKHLLLPKRDSFESECVSSLSSSLRKGERAGQQWECTLFEQSIA